MIAIRTAPTGPTHLANIHLLSWPPETVVVTECGAMLERPHKALRGPLENVGWVPTAGAGDFLARRFWDHPWCLDCVLALLP